MQVMHIRAVFLVNFRFSSAVSPITRCFVFLLLLASPVFSQSNFGELQFRITDPAGLGVKTTIRLVSEANQYDSTFLTDENGIATAKRIPYGMYRIQIRQSGFADVSESIEINSELPIKHTVKLALSPVSSSVTINDSATLIDPDQASSINEIGSRMIQDRLSSLPGRSIQDLVNSQPGWLYEGNAVLHPRGSEYQTQFVVDGIPLTDNRSPSFGPEIEAEDVNSVSIYTAGFPAEYGRKMGGVVELNTFRDPQDGLHGQVVLSGGSFDTAGAFVKTQYVWGKNVIGFSASSGMTSHYLNPVVPENYTNTGTTGDFSAYYERDLTPSDRLTLSVRHELSRYEIPNEQLQEAAGQLQNAGNSETMGIASYSHIFSPDVVADFRGMARDNSNDLYSNALSTPIIAFQHNSFREAYFKGSVSIHHGRQEWKAGIESDNIFLHENFNDVITDPTQFDPGTPTTFSFPGNQPALGTRADLEQAAFVQDTIRLGDWTVSAGLRWDHYQLLVNQNSFSPRLTIGRYFKSADMVLHASYDRIFQTPSFENILLSNSPTVVVLDPLVLRLPVLPSHGDYYEVGVSNGLFQQVRLDVNVFRRAVNNYADDDQLLNTGISFPIAFRKAILYGAEGKLELPHLGHLSGFVSYSYIVGNAWFPVTGGLFLGDDATSATTQLTGHFPDSQDQRNTLRFRFRYQLASRLWLAGGADYGSGLPFDFDGTYQQALAEYGQAVVDRINFARGRVRPSLSIDASVGTDVYKTERLSVRLQADGENLNNRLNVIDFGGLFSGNAIGPSRSYLLRLTTNF
ncbi:MAG TPA: TonB-dependent receptor [Candidatus Acidoferrales bacterium]